MWRLSCVARRWRAGGALALPLPGARSGRLTVAAVPVVPSGGPGPGGWYEWLAQSAPVHWAEGGLVALQAAAGLPWWAAIVCGAALLRTAVTLPLAAHQSRLLAKLENLQPEIKKLAERLRYEVAVRGKQLGWSEKVARFHFKKNLRRIITELYVRDNCHPFKATLLVWVQIPMWVCVSLALRNCSVGATDSEVQEQFTAGGTLWFTDLTAPDSTWILPVSLGLVNLLIVEIFASQKMQVSRFQKLATNFFRVLSVIMIPVAATVPSVSRVLTVHPLTCDSDLELVDYQNQEVLQLPEKNVHMGQLSWLFVSLQSMALYWLSSSFMGLSHNLLLRSPTFRRLCFIPKTKSDSDTPYRDIVSALRTKYSFKK